MHGNNILGNDLKYFQDIIDLDFIKQHIIDQPIKLLRHGMLGVLVGIKRGAFGFSGIRKR